MLTARREAAREVLRVIEDGVDPERMEQRRLASMEMNDFLTMVGEQVKRDCWTLSPPWWGR